MKRPVAHSLNSTWFWIELPENCCEPLKFIMKYISIQFCERPGHGRPFHALVVVYSTTQRKTHLKQSTFSHRSPCKTLHQLWIRPAATAKIATVQTRGCYNTKSLAICPLDGHACLKAMCFYWLWRIERLVWWCEIKYWITPILHNGYLPPLKIPLISLWRWVARRPYKVLSVISTNVAW